jgi:hypothetical protein
MAILTNHFLTNAVLTNGKTPFRKLRVILRLVLNFGTKTNQKSQSATQTQYQKYRPKPNQTAIFSKIQIQAELNPKLNSWIFQSMKYSQYDKNYIIMGAPKRTWFRHDLDVIDMNQKLKQQILNMRNADKIWRIVAKRSDI